MEEVVGKPWECVRPGCGPTTAADDALPSNAQPQLAVVAIRNKNKLVWHGSMRMQLPRHAVACIEVDQEVKNIKERQMKDATSEEKEKGIKVNQMVKKRTRDSMERKDK